MRRIGFSQIFPGTLRLAPTSSTSAASGTTFGALPALMTEVGGNTVITFNAADILTINGVTNAQLSARDFFLA